MKVVIKYFKYLNNHINIKKFLYLEVLNNTVGLSNNYEFIRIFIKPQYIKINSFLFFNPS